VIPGHEVGSGKLGLIVGGGELPGTLASLCRSTGRPYVVLRLRGFADPGMAEHPGVEVGIAEMTRVFDVLHREGCKAVCFAGNVKRPDFSKLKPDLRAIKFLPGVVAAALKGDDALLRHLIEQFEKEGFRVEGAQDVSRTLLLPPGPLGSLDCSDEHRDDIALGVRVAKAIGELDVGQAAVAAKGVVLALEAQEGTDEMLRRCASLPVELRGDLTRRAGVIVKWPKPIQERRIDLPTIGVATVEGAAAAGLAGVVGEAGATLVIDRPAVIAAADRLGLFVVGLEPELHDR
jgi:DUF1009 family protein